MSALVALSAEQVLYDYMMGFVGVPYRWGGNVPVDGGVDCSGLVLIYLQAAGKMPHGLDTNARGLYSHFSAKRILLGEARFGDLSFYGSGEFDVSHVGLVMNRTLMLEAGGGGPSTTTEAAAAARDAMVRVRPITYRRDFLCVLRP